MHYLNKDLEKSSRIAGKIVTAGSEDWIQQWECVTDNASACLQAVTLFAPTVCSTHLGPKSKVRLLLFLALLSTKRTNQHRF